MRCSHGQPLCLRPFRCPPSFGRLGSEPLDRIDPKALSTPSRRQASDRSLIEPTKRSLVWLHIRLAFPICSQECGEVADTSPDELSLGFPSGFIVVSRVAPTSCATTASCCARPPYPSPPIVTTFTEQLYRQYIGNRLTMSAATVPFSYAQAAKGKVAPGSTSPSTASASVAGTQDQAKDDLPNGVPEPAAPAADARNDLDALRNSKAAAIPAASVSDASCTTNNETSGSSGTSSNDSRRDDDTNSELSARRSANDTKSQAPNSRASHSRPASTAADSKKPRRERKTKGAGNGSKNADKESDAAEAAKDAPPPPKPELFDSPIPATNPWQQRLATTKPSASDAASVNAATPAQSSARKGAAAAASSSSQAKPASDAVATNGLGIHRRGGDGDAPGKSGGAPYKNGARRAAEQLPSSDSAHWPTPDTATKDLKQQQPSTKPAESQESHSQDGQASQKGKQPKNWVKMDFVPSVSFKTQIPPKGGRPRGGARGGRDGTTRGGHSANAAKDGEKGSGPSAKVNGDAHEGARDAPANGRGSSVPPTTKRGSADAPSFRDQRKPMPAAARSKDSATNVSSPSHDTDPRRSPPSVIPKGVVDILSNQHYPVSPPQPSVPLLPHYSTPPRPHHQVSPPQHNPSSVTPGLIFGHQDQPREKHEGRGERTRGGPRGRGGYHASTSQFNGQHTTFTPGYTSNVTSRQNPYSPPIRQNQFNSYGSAPSRGGGRGGRGGSSATRASGSNGNGRHAPASMMGYDPSFHQASMMGYPQTPSPAFFLEPYVLSTLTAQISWYFSIQNLCRDIYLRSHMDSQGFVPLSLIAGFNRVTSLLSPAHDVVQYVRQACVASTEAECVVGDDGMERLRTLNNPRHWVLPMEDRVDSARNDGPTSFLCAPQQYPQGGLVQGGYPTAAPTMNSYPAAFGDSRSFSSPASPSRGPELINGHSAGQGTEVGQTTTLKPTVPEFSPRTGTGDFPKAQTGGTNASTPLESQSEATSTTGDDSANNAASS